MRNQNIGVSKFLQFLFKYLLGAFVSVNNTNFFRALRNTLNKPE